MSNMLKKGSGIRSTEREKESFNDIKRYLGQASLLINLYFSKDFIFFSIASEHNISGVLL